MWSLPFQNNDMKYTKLVIVSTNELDKRINQLFVIRELIKRGVQVEYWNVSALTYNITMPLDEVEGVNMVTFSKYKEIKAYILNHLSPKTLYLVYMNFDGKTAFLYRLLSKYHQDMAYCVNGVLPALPFNSSRWKNFKLSRVLRNRFCTLLKKTKLFAPLKYQLNTCGLAEVDYKIDEKTKIIPFNSTDYVTAQKMEDFKIEEPYLVFIDQYLPLHPDNQVLGFKAIDVDKYYASINYVFSLLEERMKCRVVIAAHPIAQEYKKHNPFDGREIYFYKTNSLVKKSMGVICHHSTAISFIALFNKPMIVLVSDEIKERMTRIYDYCNVFSSILGGKLVNMDHLPSEIEFPQVDKDKYSAYKYNYVTNLESEYKSNADILYSILSGDYE